MERAIKRGAGAGDDENYDEVRYEGYGISGVAIMVDCLTDNINRTVSDVRHAFTKAGGNLGTDGSVAYLFTKMGVINYPAGADEDAIMEVALEAGADDVASHEDGSIDVLTTADDFVGVKQALIDAGHEPESADVTMHPATTVDLNVEDAEKVLRLVDALEDLDDVQSVYSNADISADVMAQMS